MATDYESSRLLAEYLLFHYGTKDEVLPPDRRWPIGMGDAIGFPRRTAGHFRDGMVGRSLDLGCSVGRSSFELARTSREVVGLDYSKSFIDTARRIASGAEVYYERHEEGKLGTPLVASLPAGVDASRVTFLQGDAMALPEDIGVFDRVHAANLLCRLSDPQRLLERLPALVVAGGELVIATPCTWMEEFTPPEKWPEGDTLTWLRAELKGGFKLVHHVEEAFLIRETARKFQWSTAMVTVWKRK